MATSARGIGCLAAVRHDQARSPRRTTGERRASHRRPDRSRRRLRRRVLGPGLSTGRCGTGARCRPGGGVAAAGPSRSASCSGPRWCLRRGASTAHRAARPRSPGLGVVVPPRVDRPWRWPHRARYALAALVGTAGARRRHRRAPRRAQRDRPASGRSASASCRRRAQPDPEHRCRSARRVDQPSHAPGSSGVHGERRGDVAVGRSSSPRGGAHQCRPSSDVGRCPCRGRPRLRATAGAGSRRHRMQQRRGGAEVTGTHAGDRRGDRAGCRW